MTKRARHLIGAGLYCATMVTLTIWGCTPSNPPVQLLAQRGYSNKCQTPVGLCYVPAAPIGSACFCENSNQWGTIVP